MVSLFRLTLYFHFGVVIVDILFCAKWDFFALSIFVVSGPKYSLEWEEQLWQHKVWDLDELLKQKLGKGSLGSWSEREPIDTLKGKQVKNGGEKYQCNTSERS